MPSWGEIAKKRNIKYFLISFVDLFGTMRAKIVPASAIDDVAKAGAGFAGFAAWFDLTPADPDVLAIPEQDTLIQLPWKPEVAWVTGDLFMGGEPVDQNPRQVLKRVIADAAKLGYEFKTGVECEYFLIAPDGSTISDAADQQAKPCYDQQALMRRYDVVAEICDAMVTLGWKPYQNDHEDANGQFEMNWEYDSSRCAPPTSTPSSNTWSSRSPRSTACARPSCPSPSPTSPATAATCMPRCGKARPRTCSPMPRTNSACRRRPTSSSPASCIRRRPYAPSPIRLVNSYKRINAPVTLSGATWSPNSVTYTGNNRTHMIRIPDAGRFEFRLADGAANPYLLHAAVLAAGLDGIRNGRDPGKRLDINMYTDGHKANGAKKLPLNLLDALRALDKSSVLKAALGEKPLASYVKLKQDDWNAYSRHLTDWERQTTLDC